MTTKTLYVYLALNPADFEETKYFFRDASDIKKYEKVPMRIRVRSPRGVKYVLELIEHMAAIYEMKLLKIFEPQSYVLPYESFDVLFNRQLIKLIETKSGSDDADGDDEVEYAASEVPSEPVSVAEVVGEETEVEAPALEEPTAEEPVIETPAPIEEPKVEAPIAEEPKVEDPIAEEPHREPGTVTVIEETPAEKLQTAELIEAERIHVAFLERICRQFDADELNAHVKVVYKKRREKKTSVFDIIMRRNRRD